MAEGFTIIETQEQFDAAIKTRLEKQRAKYADYDDLKSQIEELNEEKSALEKTISESGEKFKDLQLQLDEANKKVKGFELDSLKTNVAIEKGLPLELRSRLTGETKEDIEADADNLVKIFGEQNRKGLPGFSVHEHGGEEDKERAAYKELLSGLNIKKE